MLAALITASPASAITNGSRRRAHAGHLRPGLRGQATSRTPAPFTPTRCIPDPRATPVRGITPAKLPAAGSLSRLPKDQRFTSVGYGAYEVTNGPGGHRYLHDDVRGVATGTLDAINETLLRISMSPSTGNGGTRYGDSGGPDFLGTSNTIAAITVTGDAVCRSTNVDDRLDTESARAFLDDYVRLP